MAFLCSMMVTSSCISTFSLPRSSSVQSFSTQTNTKEGQKVEQLKELRLGAFGTKTVFKKRVDVALLGTV